MNSACPCARQLGSLVSELNRQYLSQTGPLTGGFDHRTANIIQKKVVERGKRNAFTRVLYARNDKDAIVTWGLKLDRILNVFNVRSTA